MLFAFLSKDYKIYFHKNGRKESSRANFIYCFLSFENQFMWNLLRLTNGELF